MSECLTAEKDCTTCGHTDFISGYCDALHKHMGKSIAVGCKHWKLHENIEEPSLSDETMYGHCLAENPYWFIPDAQCNTDEELLSWRHALFAVKQGTFECPEHFFWKTIDDALTREEANKLLNECGTLLLTKDEQGQRIVHGHNTPWGMGINAFSDRVNVWEEFPFFKPLLELAESDISDNEFLARVKKTATRG